MQTDTIRRLEQLLDATPPSSSPPLSSSSSSASHGSTPPVASSAKQWSLYFFRNPTPFLDAKPKHPPWPVQERSIERILDREATPFHKGGGGAQETAALLGDRPGGGKTNIVALVQLRDAQARVRAEGHFTGRFGHPTLIVVPSHLIGQWQEHFRTWDVTMPPYPPPLTAQQVCPRDRQCIGRAPVDDDEKCAAYRGGRRYAGGEFVD